MCLIYYFPLFVINLCLSVRLCLISVVSCSGVNTQREKKVELIEINWFLFWIASYCLLLCPFPRVFLWCQMLQQGFVISLECTLHGCCKTGALRLSNLYFRCLC